MSPDPLLDVSCATDLPRPGEVCSCGQPPVVVYVFGDRRVPYCGVAVV